MRYLPLTDADRKAMLAKIGVADIDALFADVPKDKRLGALVDLPRAKGELEVERELGRLAARNVAAGSVPFFVGAGAYKHHVPATVDHLIQRSEFLTSYTPYQPEIAQGTLQYLFEFQTQVAMLTGMEVANASMYDGSTAAAEAVLMAHRVTKRRNRAVLAGNLHPALPRDHRDGGAPGRARDRRAAAGTGAARRTWPRISTATVSCVVVQTPGFLRAPARSDAARREGACGRRAADRRVHGGRVAGAGAAAGCHGRRHRGGRGAIDRQCALLRRALRRACSRRGRSWCARCRAACAARPWTRRAGAASC